MTSCIIRPIAESDAEGFHAAIKNKNPQFVVEADGKIIGWCDVVRKGFPINRHTGVLGIGLLPDWRGNGIGRKLMRKTIDAAIEQGFQRIELGVREHNENALHLYKSLGFVVEGLKRREYKVDDVYEDGYIMSLLVDETT